MNSGSISSGASQNNPSLTGENPTTNTPQPKAKVVYTSFAQLTAAAKAFAEKTRASEESGDNGLGGNLSFGA